MSLIKHLKILYNAYSKLSLGFMLNFFVKNLLSQDFNSSSKSKGQFRVSFYIPLSYKLSIPCYLKLVTPLFFSIRK